MAPSGGRDHDRYRIRRDCRVHDAHGWELDAKSRRNPSSTAADERRLALASVPFDRSLGHPQTGPRRTLQTASEGSNGPVCSGATPFGDGPGCSLSSLRNPRVAFGSDELFRCEKLDLNSDSGLGVLVRRRSAPESVRIESETAVRIFSEMRVRFRRNPHVTLFCNPAAVPGANPAHIPQFGGVPFR